MCVGTYLRVDSPKRVGTSGRSGGRIGDDRKCVHLLLMTIITKPLEHWYPLRGSFTNVMRPALKINCVKKK